MRALIGVLLLALLLTVAGCGGLPAASPVESPQETSYSVSGIVQDADGAPVESVVFSFGPFGIASSDAHGRWAKSNLTGSVVIHAAKDGYTITPPSIAVDGPRADLVFIAEVNAPPPDAEVVILEALVDPNPAWAASAYHDRVQLTLTNLGGPGYFKVQFWGKRPNIINPPLELFAETEVYEVTADWIRTATWDVQVPGTALSSTYIQEIVILSRNVGELNYRETSRVTPQITNGL